MDLGVIVNFEGQRWRVLKRDGFVKTVTLVRWGGTTREIAEEHPGAVVVANPSDWPVVTARVKPTAGPIQRLTLQRGVISRALTPFVEWVPSDLFRSGGSIFMSPLLKLKIGESLRAEYQDGSSSRIVITKRYGSMAQRRARPQKPIEKEKKKGLLDILEGEDFIE